MLADNLTQVENKVKAALAARKEPKATGDAVTIVAVTKNHPAEVVTEALAAGLTNVGENRVQEAMNKLALGERDIIIVAHKGTIQNIVFWWLGFDIAEIADKKFSVDVRPGSVTALGINHWHEHEQAG